MVSLGRVIGLEPTNGGTTTHCLNHLATPARYLRKYIIKLDYFQSSLNQ